MEKTYDFNIVATGADAANTVHTVPVKLIVGFNFSLNNNSDGQTIAAGQSATYELDAIPLGNGSVFPSNLTLSCSSTGLPPAKHMLVYANPGGVRKWEYECATEHRHHLRQQTNRTTWRQPGPAMV